MVTEGDLTWGGEHTKQYTDDVGQNCTPKTYIILLTNVTPMNSIKIKDKMESGKRALKGALTLYYSSYLVKL